MTNYKVTIIIPAYNAAKYIKDCLDSVFCQTYKNIEVIVVDDGSTDNTAEIVKSYNNVFFLSKDNGGSSSARNYGVKHASGKYIIFIDSDDYIEKDYVSTLISYTNNEDGIIVVSNFLIDGIEENRNWTFLKTKNKNEIFSLFLKKGIHNRMNKLIPSKIVKETPFPEGQDIMEDASFTSHILEKCSELIRIPYAGYNYMTRSESLTNKKLNQKQTAGKYSNILEKDLTISKYISEEEDISCLSKTASVHIFKTIESINDLNQFNIFNKMLALLEYLTASDKINKKQKHFLSKLSKSKTPRAMKRRYYRHEFLRGSLSKKLSIIKIIINGKQ